MSKIGRNESCPCGSGKKYKKCCDGRFNLSIGKRNKLWTKEDVKKLPTPEIILKLKLLGIQFNIEEFQSEILSYYSAMDLAESWYMKFNLNIKGFEDDFPWLAAYVLWERLAPEHLKCYEQIDDMMLKGYEFVQNEKVEDACNIWLEVWNQMKSRFLLGIKSVEEVDSVFHGEVFFSNWCQDFEMELENVSTENESFYRKRIDYVSEFCETLPNSSEEIIQNMKRAEAESYFGLGNIEQGEEKFMVITNLYPNWVWGYIGWGDMYGNFRLNKNVPYDQQKARSLYMKALEIAQKDKNKSDIEIIQERLEDLIFT